jgi:hypothetical protein
MEHEIFFKNIIDLYKKDGYLYSNTAWSWQDCLQHILRAVGLPSQKYIYVSIGSPSIDSFGLPYPVFWHGGYFNLETKEFDHLFAHEHISFKTKNEINITEEHFISLLHRYRYAEEISISVFSKEVYDFYHPIWKKSISHYSPHNYVIIKDFSRLRERFSNKEQIESWIYFDEINRSKVRQNQSDIKKALSKLIEKHYVSNEKNIHDCLFAGSGNPILIHNRGIFYSEYLIHLSKI